MDDQELRDRKLIDESRLVGRRRSPIGWLLLLLAVLLVAWFLWARANDKTDEQSEQKTAQQQAAEAVNGNRSILSDFNGIYGVTDIADLDHREIEVNNLTVKRVISDKVFVVTNDPKGPLELYVVSTAEGQTAVKAGQKVNLKGYIELASNLKGDEAGQWGLNDEQYQELKDKIVYGVASKVEQTAAQ